VVVSVQNLLQSAEHKIHSIEHATGGDFPLFLTALTLTSTMMYKVFNKIQQIGFCLDSLAEHFVVS
jgi:hypothetical protein